MFLCVINLWTRGWIALPCPLSGRAASENRLRPAKRIAGIPPGMLVASMIPSGTYEEEDDLEQCIKNADNGHVRIDVFVRGHLRRRQ